MLILERVEEITSEIKRIQAEAAAYLEELSELEGMYAQGYRYTKDELDTDNVVFFKDYQQGVQ